MKKKISKTKDKDPKKKKETDLISDLEKADIAYKVLKKMNNKSYRLTKSKINSGIQCKKKLWFDIHDKLKTETAEFKRGERFNEVVRKHYTKLHGKELNLDGVWDDLVNKTKNAINQKDINVIYEATFEYLDTQVRTDVLIRKKNGWELLEAKSSTKLKDEYIDDISIQSFIVRECLKQINHNLISCKLIHINNNFILDKTENYEKLIIENDISNSIIEVEVKVPEFIKEFLPLAEKNAPCPKIKMGDHCKKPHACNYQDRCKSQLPKNNVTSFTILPYVNKKLKAYMDEIGTTDLQKVPRDYPFKRKDYVANVYQIIQEAHKNNQDYIDPGLKNLFKNFTFPFYFMDFETIMQGVPLIKETKPYEQVPFQWSVHKWESVDKEIDEGKSFLKFTGQNIEKQFAETLLDAVGEKGTIFSHHGDSVEVRILKDLKLKDSCKDLTDRIDKLIERTHDTLILTKMNFYSPLMNGNWGIKSIIKAIPSCPINYEEKDNIAGGNDAQLAWFICTDPKTDSNKREKQEKLLIDYCSKDTLALYYLVKYLMEKTNNN